MDDRIQSLPRCRIVYQATRFCIAFLHFFQRANRPDRSSVTSEPDPRLYSRRGTGWLAVGLKLGAIEAVVGFAGFAYAPSLTRRYLRTVGRTFMVAGVCVRYALMLVSSNLWASSMLTYTRST